MGVCDSSNNSDFSIFKNKEKTNSKKNSSSIKHQKKNYYNAPIKGNSNIFNNNNNNLSMSKSQLTLGTTINEHPFQRPKMYVYNNKSSFQTSYINGSSMLNGNSMAKGSKLNPDSMSISHSRSYGEIIIDGKMNPEMKGDKDFKNFLDENNNEIDGSIKNNNDTDEKNKKDVNLYHRISKNISSSGNKNDKNK